MAESRNGSKPQLSDKPQPSSSDIGFGSDAIAEQLSRLNLKYIALVPGSSYRGLHDSLVNYKGNASPEMLVCLHEEHAVSIAHGYAKVTGKPIAVGLHANVGLMHATMAIYNAFTDRVPMVILGATGPLDATRRRPWIDWLHTATDQAALVRPFIKFDDQPHSPNAAIASLVHATAATSTKPCAPVYICLDLSLQEDEVDPSTLHFPDTKRYLNIESPGPSSEDVSRLLPLLQNSKRTLFMFGRMNASKTCWQERVQLAERYDARVVTDLKQACSFPTDHQLHPSQPGVFLAPETLELIRSADLIVSWDWVDLAGALQTAHEPGVEPKSKIVHISLDAALHNGWSKDHFGLPLADITIRADPDKALSALLRADDATKGTKSEWPDRIIDSIPNMAGVPNGTGSEGIFMTDVARALYSTILPEDICLVRVPLSWKGVDLRTPGPLAFMGMDGGAGIGSGPGQVVGTSLALRETSSKLLPVAVLGDGDFSMGSSALWTAARYRLPLLVIVANNGSYFNDEVHQERVAKRRGRPVENKWIGMRLDDPAPDVHKMAEGLGCTVVSGVQIKKASELQGVLEQAVKAVRDGKSVVVDVQVLPEGYSSALEKAK
ncbi:hypothetical protein LTR37_004873 [Vermiconidia calcicola]|uniref:Uncharacterized protein n=1 Tax=Vermiconidia calcicola TaxID=1690605 RepID=A0ACC3NKW9_9PEZI|nr:hypothetical protein LTR37_004873 [Vermiconidia calcicola]